MIIVDYDISVNDCIENQVLFYSSLIDALEDIERIVKSSDTCDFKIYKCIEL